MNSELQMWVAELKLAYGSRGYVTSEECTGTKHLFKKIEGLCESFEDYVYVLTNVHHTKSSTRFSVFFRAALKKAQTLQQLKAVWPFIPNKWKNERYAVLKSAADLTSSRDELYGLLIEFGIL